MPTDTNTRGGRQAAYDMRRLRSEHGDEVVRKRSPWHQKNAPAPKAGKKVVSGGNPPSKAKRRKTSDARTDEALRKAGAATKYQ